jgi:MerR family transcriptional regulator/heat shock protein HspR
MDHITPDEACYVISVVARMVNLHPQTLRYYERIGLVVPARSAGNVRLYSEEDIQRLRKICRLTEELGVNLAGVDVIMRLTDTIEQLQVELNHIRMTQEIDKEVSEHLNGNGNVAHREEPSQSLSIA